MIISFSRSKRYRVRFDTPPHPWWPTAKSGDESRYSMSLVPPAEANCYTFSGTNAHLSKRKIKNAHHG